MKNLQLTIETLFEARQTLTQETITAEQRDAIIKAIELLNTGRARVAEPSHDGWQVNQWLKKAVLLYFRMFDNQRIDGHFTQFYDKVPLKYVNQSEEELKESGVRIVPPACARYGSFIAKNTILMPSYVNIGAYIDSGSMIDTWATVGSCAQIGKNVHLSGGVGIGGVLEPLQANPTIIEDDCFIGARSEVVEGVIVGKGSVISMGVYLGQSTKIYNRATGEISYGKIPPYSVVVSGTLPAKDNSHSLYCAVIVKQVDAQTRSKTQLNELLRD
ncbi:MAG: 2,3,4,5-tetrahydropyridine-2,6-dicarboxylate N-succinyltransferase [Legionellales bacterium]|jgi:2,3,4,5-tetrahydropyridine-2-carboxylate N-succinyltransferase